MTAWADRAAAARHAGKPLALLFDYDGTLTPIVPHPSLAKLPGPTRRLLGRFAADPCVAVAVISGRSLDDVRDLTGLDGLYLAGSGGLELDLLGESRRYPVPDDLLGAFDEVHRHINVVLPFHPGAWVERKPGALSAHYRALAKEPTASFLTAVAGALAHHPALRWRLVSESVEVTPADGWDKGTAVAAVLDHAAARFGEAPLPLFFGDAPNDTEAMETVNALGGETIGVGPDAPEAARHNCPDPAALAAALDALARAVL